MTLSPISCFTFICFAKILKWQLLWPRIEIFLHMTEEQPLPLPYSNETTLDYSQFYRVSSFIHN